VINSPRGINKNDKVNIIVNMLVFSKCKRRPGQGGSQGVPHSRVNHSPYHSRNAADNANYLSPNYKIKHSVKCHDASLDESTVGCRA